MVQKKLQPDSTMNILDRNNDGVVDDSEIAALEAIDRHRKYKVQERIVVGTAASMFAFTLAMFFLDNAKITALAPLSNLFYVAGGGVIAAFFGFNQMRK